MKFLREEEVQLDAIIDKVEEDDNRCTDTDRVGAKKCRPLNDLQKRV